MSIKDSGDSQLDLFDTTSSVDSEAENNLFFSKKKKKIVFKPYDMNQLTLLPPSLEDLIPEDHLVRVVNDAINNIDIEPLLRQYKGGGTSSYHPKMMLKVLVYAYTQKLYSSRQIAKALRENINFMWISGNNRPDFRTINRFRSSVMKNVIDDVFTAVIFLLIEEGYVKLENYFLDGTKIEANANKYTWVWRKSTTRYKAKLQENIKKLLDEIEKYNEQENEIYKDQDLEELGNGGSISSEKIKDTMKELNEKLASESNNRNEIDSEQNVEEPNDDEAITSEELAKKVKKLEEALAQEPSNKELQKAVKIINKDYLPRCQKYEKQEALLNGRNSYSKTDTDATFMRMKEDHMKNGQLKPGYNIQIGTENQFIVGFSVHQKPNDSTCLIPHLEGVKKRLGKLPENLSTDAGYGSEENYEYIEQENIGNYVKYNTFHKEQKKKFKQEIFRVENLQYNPEKDEFYCPAGKKLIYKETRKRKTDNGYLTEYRVYEAEDCNGCPLKEKCTKAKGNRQININFNLNKHKEKAKINLCSPQGLELRSLRGVEVEPVFGRIKHNWSFKRFFLRGLKKVKTEWGLLSIAHNISKMVPSK